MLTSSLTRSSAQGLAAVAFAALLVLSACGSSDDDSGASGGDDGSSSAPSDDASTDSDTDDVPAPDTSSGDGTGTLTMADGTVYEFEMNSCDTFDTDPATIPLAGGYDLSGSTSDGEFRFSLARLGFDDEVAVAVGTLEGDFDENGQNEKLLYIASRESLDLNLIAIDGGNVSGQVEFSAIAPTRPHGDDTTATVEVNC
ncbi:MAG: major membrane immunogen (membrane-anchored lipoprotein) [Ilumatobacter sp.]|jgi:major membrane immunogen (membrane-anchored lipoprotein)